MGESLVRSAGDGGCTTLTHRARCRNAERISMLRRLFEFVAAGFIAGAMTSCGGGGDRVSLSPSPTPAPAPSPSPMPIPAQLSVPEPVGYSVDQMAAFNRLNEIRVAAGLGMLSQDTRLDHAARAHMDWQLVNDVMTHVELAGTEGFFGENWWDRDIAAGYSVAGGGEVLAFGDSPARGIEALVYGPYHRAALFEFDPVDVGIGWSSRRASNVVLPLVVEFSSPKDEPSRSAGQMAQAGTSAVVIWPLDGAKDLATHMGDEVPSPVPNVDAMELGTSASISVETGASIETTSFSIVEDASGVLIPSVVLDKSRDSAHLLAGSFVAVIPLEGLKINTVYRVEFVGKILRVDLSLPQAYSRTWRFATGEWAYPPQY